MKEVVIIGAGNVGTHLTLALKNSGCAIKQVFSRNLSNADCLARLVGAEPISDLNLVYREASFYILSVSDKAIHMVCELMPRVKGIVAHTAGSVDLSALEKFEFQGVMYPMQTFIKEVSVDFREIPILVEGNCIEACQALTGLASLISDNIHLVNGEQREMLHVAAVFSSNFVNHLYSIAHELVEARGLDFNLLKPLIAETTRKALLMNPLDVQTGPARRRDFQVMRQHIEKLDDRKLYSEIYNLVSKSILNRYHPGSPFFN